MAAPEPVPDHPNDDPSAAGVQHIIRQLLLRIKNFVEAAGCDAANLDPGFILTRRSKYSDLVVWIND